MGEYADKMAAERQSQYPGLYDRRPVVRHGDGSIGPSKTRHPKTGYPEMRKQERMVVVERNRAARADRTPQQQLALLNKRLGKNVGAQRERARLHSLIESSSS